MTSRNLFFKLLKEDLKHRVWAIALLSLGMFFAFPVAAALMAGDVQDYAVYEQGLRNLIKNMTVWVSFENPLTVFIILLSALVCGLSSFAYLNSRSKVDFYHGIPVRREKLFLANYIGGILIPAVPFAVFLAMAVLVGAVNGVPSGNLAWTALKGYGLHMTYYFLAYSLTVTAAMMTGHLVVGFLGTMVLCFYVPLATVLFNGYCVTFYHSYYNLAPRWWYDWGVRLSPVLEYVRQVGRYQDGEQLLPAVAGALFVGLVLTAIAAFLYRHRPSEAAGRAMAFPVSRPIICVFLTILSAAGLGDFFWEIRSSVGWAVFGVLCGGVVCHCVVQIIYHFDFRKLFACRLQLLACLAVSVGALLVFRYDLTGYDRYLPREEQVRESVVYTDYLVNWVSYGTTKEEDGPLHGYIWEKDPDPRDYAMEHMHLTDPETVLAIAREGVRVLEEATEDDGRLRTQEAASAEMSSLSLEDQLDLTLRKGEEDDPRWSFVVVRYTMNSGREVYRRYSVQVNGMVEPWIERLYQDENYQKGSYPLMGRSADSVGAVRVRKSFEKETVMNQLSEEEKKELLETYQREFAALSFEDMKKELPAALIRFTTETDEAAISRNNKILGMSRGELEELDSQDYYYTGRYSDIRTRDFYPVYPSFKDTIAILKEHGVEVGDYLKDLPVSSVRVTMNLYFYSGSDAWRTSNGEYTVTITDMDQIMEMRPLLDYQGLRYYDPLYQSDNVTRVWLEWNEEEPEGQEWEEDYTETATSDAGIQKRLVQVTFRKGTMPEFVKEAFREKLHE